MQRPSVTISCFHNTFHTGTTTALELLTEYTPGGILDTEVWGQSFNNTFLLGVIKATHLVKLVTVLTTHSCKGRLALLPKADAYYL